jgi:hypothetical protein
MATGQDFMVKVYQTYASRNCLNVWFYHQTAGSGDSEELWAKFDDVILPLMAPIQNSGVSYITLEVLNLSNLDDFKSQTPSTIVGTLTGDALAAFVASSFIFHRSTRQVRNGSKRFTGLTETAINGDSIAGGLQSAMLALAEAMGDALEDVEGNVWEPMIAKRHSTGTPPVTTYTLYGITGCDFRVLYTTQNTRK